MAQYIVTLKQRDQLDGFYADMKEGGYKLISKRPISRCTHYDLTESQADTIAGDSRVLAVELHPDEDDNLIIGPHGYVNNEVAVAAGDFYKGITSDSGDYQWGHLHCAGDDVQRRKGTWGSGSVTDTAEWFNNGKHVDVVICDNNAAYDCQEWYSTHDPAKNRYVQYDWYANHNTEALSIDDDGYTSAPSNYTKYYPNAGHTDYHGTHVAGTVAGKYYGWATEANIYTIQCLSGMDPNPLPTMIMMDYLRAFHRSKAINPETGHRNPTVTNHSWGSGWDLGPNGSGIFDTGYTISDITEIVWRGTTYSSSNPGPSGWTMAGIHQDFGIGQSKTYIPYYNTAMAADIEDAVEDGIVVIASAGNSDFYVATDSTSPDWNNIVQFDTSKVSFNMSAGQGRAYYNRGSAPGNAPGAICVGSLDKASDFSKSSFSCYGEAIDVWAPGTHINSAFNSLGYNDAKYGGDNFFYAISGTSMASPQVTGVAACLATGKERFTNSDVKSFLQNYCKDSDMTFDDTYTSARHLIYPVQLTPTANGWDVTGDQRYGDHINVINPTIEIFEGDSIDFQLMAGGTPLYITTSPVTGLSGGATPQGQVSWFPHQGANTTGTFQASPPWPGSAGDYYYVCGDMSLSFTTWPQGILRVHPPLHFDDPHIGAGSVNKYLLAANPRPLADGFPSRWYQQQLKGRRRDVEATSNNPPNMQLYPRENVYHRGFKIHQRILLDEAYWINDITLPSNSDSTNSENQVRDFALDSNGNFWICGARDDNAGALNSYIVNITKTGVYNASVDCNAATTLTPFGIAVDDNDDIYTYHGYGKLAKFSLSGSSLTLDYCRESEWGGGSTFGEGMGGRGCLFANGTDLTLWGNRSGTHLGHTFDGTTGDVSSGGYTYVNGGNQAYVYFYGANKIGGTIYACGRSSGGNINSSNAFWVVATVGYGVAGSMKFYSGVSNATCYGVTRDSDNKFYVCGQMDNVPTLMKIDAYNNGVIGQGVAWGRKLNTSGRYSDIAADSQGCVYAATLYGQIVKYNSSGTIIWAKSVGNEIQRITIVDDVIHGIGTIGNTSFKVFRLPISGEGLTDWSITDYSFTYTNQGGLGGPATQSDFGSTANSAVIWGNFTSSDYTMNTSSEVFTPSLTNL